MKYVPPVGQPADTSYENFDPANGVDGSVVSAEAIEHPQREIINAIIALGLTPVEAELDQLAQALTIKFKAGGHKHNIADVDKLQTALDGKSPTGHTHVPGDITGGLTTSRKLTTTAPLSGGGDLSADRTLQIDLGQGLKVVNKLLALAVAADSALVFKYTETTKIYEIDIDFSQMPTGKFEEMLKSIRVSIWLESNKTWYVNADSGSDQNDGTTAAKAFKTIQAAIDNICNNYNLGGYIATVNVAAGNYANVQLKKYNTVGGQISIRGAGIDLTFISNANGATISTADNAGYYIVSDATVTCSTSVTATGIHSALVVNGGGRVRVERIKFIHNELVASSSASQYIVRANGGTIEIYDGCTIQSNGMAGVSNIWILAGTRSGSLLQERDVTIQGICSVTLNLGALSLYERGVTLPVIAGEVAGRRHTVKENSIASTRNGGTGYFPGTTDGNTLSGGQIS